MFVKFMKNLIYGWKSCNKIPRRRDLIVKITIKSS